MTGNRRFPILSLVLIVAAMAMPAEAQVADFNEQTALGNKPERVARFADLGFGIFIHWSVDSQLGSVISHSLVGADEDFCRRYFTELPATFNPKRFDPHDWADLFKFVGAKYVVFTAKHHSGFCMFETATTDFNIMNTPYGGDVTGQLIEALRSRGIAVGLYFSPDDFWFLHRQGTVIGRRQPGVTPQENPKLMDYDRRQIRELLTKYGSIDIFFIDGPAEGLRELCWEIQPEIVVTRGALKTPEQYIPGVPPEDPWESNLTMGTQWQYKPTHETYKSGTELIEMLIETRAKGGNFLLNIGPKPDGMIPIEQEERLRELALWNFVNRDAIHGVEPWIVTNEDNIWFTKKRDAETVYAIVTRPNWVWGKRREITLQSVKTGTTTAVSVLGQTGKVLEYSPGADVRTRWHQSDEGLVISAARAQRIHNDRKWPNAVVLKVTDAHPAVDPPIVVTKNAKAIGSGRVTLTGELVDLGDAASVKVGFQVRLRHETTQPLATADPWEETMLSEPRSAPGNFSLNVPDLESGQSHEFRAVVKHPHITLYGDRKALAVR